MTPLDGHKSIVYKSGDINIMHIMLLAKYYECLNNS